MRAAVRRVLDGRVEIGEHALFPPDVERCSEIRTTCSYAQRKSSTSRATCWQAPVTTFRRRSRRTRNEVGKKLTVIASLVLVPSFIVGYYGQNFAGVFDRAFWTLGVSTGLIVVSTLIQLTIFRWRRWI
jgi:Mg2+ and Co2+ transporter CorA